MGPGELRNRPVRMSVFLPFAHNLFCIVDNRDRFLAETPKPKKSCLKKNRILDETEYYAKMNLFGQNSVFRPKETVSAIIICFSTLFQSKIKGHIRSIFDKTGLFQPKCMFLPNTETDKSGSTKTETYFGRKICPKLNRNDIRLSTTMDGPTCFEGQREGDKRPL